MNEVYKYCKFCNETKNINDFCKSGMFVKNICKECWNKKTRERYKNSKLVEEKDKEIERLNNIINELEKDMRERYHKEIDYQSKIMQSDLMQGDYPVSYYYAEQNEKLLNYYLNRLQELKGDGSND